MSKMMKKSLALIALLLATTTAIAQVPVLKKPVVLAPQVKPALPPAVLKTPIKVVTPPPVVEKSPTRYETARRLKLQNQSAAATLTAIRAAFARDLAEEISSMRVAGYRPYELAVAFKEADQLTPSVLLLRMPFMGFNEGELAPQLRSLYGLDFDALLVALRQVQPHGFNRGEFGYALDAMGYTAEQMVQAGYRYFVGGFPDPNIGGGTPYPSAKQLYNLLMMDNPLREHVRIDHYALFQLLMASGYSPEQVIAEVPMGRYSPVVNRPMDEVSNCIAATSSNAGMATGAVDERINPLMVIQMAPNGTATYADGRRTCMAKFLGLLRANGTGRDVAGVLADRTVKCAPATNIACPAQRAQEIERILREAGYAP